MIRNTHSTGARPGLAEFPHPVLHERVTGSVRWHTGGQIPSYNALIPLVVILAKGPAWTASERRLARRWLLLAGVRGTFSGAAQTELDRVLKKLGAAPSVDGLWNATKSGLSQLRSSDFETGRLSGPVMSLYLSMLRDKDARDWEKHEVRLDGSVVGDLAQLQVHHVFPRALLNKMPKITAADIDTFANYAVLRKGANLGVSTKEPTTYIAWLKVPKAELRKQCMPENQDLWHVTKYKDFLAARRKLLA